MIWKTSRSPYLSNQSDAPDDYLILVNSFEGRCHFAADSAASMGYRTREAILIEYESGSVAHAKAKSLNRRRLLADLAAIVTDASQIRPIFTTKHDVLGFAEDMTALVSEIQDKSRVTLDVSTMTKCTLAALLRLLNDSRRDIDLRCIWTPRIYSDGMESTEGVKETFVVPGFGGLTSRPCRVLVLFLGHETDRAYSLWRATDPDLVYLIASESEYSVISYDVILEGLEEIQALCECRELVVDGTEPSQSYDAMRAIALELRERDFDDSVAVGCLGTKFQLLGLWTFLEEYRQSRPDWSYIYSIPVSYRTRHEDRTTLNEIIETRIRLPLGRK